MSKPNNKTMKRPTIIGSYFLTYKHGNVKGAAPDKQGIINDVVGERFLYVTYFSWMDGCENGEGIIPITKFVENCYGRVFSSKEEFLMAADASCKEMN